MITLDKIQSNKSLKPYNTFGFDVNGKYFIECENQDDIINSITFCKKNNISLLVLGGGSNILFTKDYDGLVLKNNLKGIQVIETNNDFVLVKANAGENWHQFVLTAVANNWCGIENLSLIPGTIGASPIQNIGAYGVEVKDFIVEVEVLLLDTLEVKKITKKDCHFGYRDSIFKNELKNKCIILNVLFQFSTHPKLNLSYGAIGEKLIEKNIGTPSIKDVSDIVISIRESKLPNPKEIGNAGSFFKNPEIKNEQFEQLFKLYPNIPNYKSPLPNHTKIAAGWLIEQCGWKGFRKENIGVHKNQALVLVNYGDGHGNELLALCNEIIESVQNKFSIRLETEVNII
jgi:UDP-N-acetylmuramate dehydrogenase